MRKFFMLVAALSALVSVFASDASDGRPRRLKVLMIGNSFSICNLKQMPPVAASMGLELDLVSLYIGGCSLERHWNNVVAGTTNATVRPYKTTWSYASLADQSKVPFASVLADGEDWKKRPEKRSNIPAMLAADRWDVVTVQQASHFSWRAETYFPYGDFLVAEIRKLAPQAKIVVQETWSYPPWDKRLKSFGVDQVDMYAHLHNAYRGFADKYGFEVIPVGTAAEFVSERDTLFNRPDFHFNRDGEYLQGLAFTAKLFGVDVRKCPYRPGWMEAARAEEIKAAVMDAVEGRGVARRAFRDAKLTRGNTNVVRGQPIDDASWVWLPGDSGRLVQRELWDEAQAGGDSDVRFLKFRRTFSVLPGEGAFVIDVSADERFYLTLDGALVGRGPNRSTVENWQYNTYVVEPGPGEHVLEAVVWQAGDHGPLAQLSHRGGFVLRASGAFDARLTTGRAEWQVGRLDGFVPIGKDGGAWGMGEQFEITGAGPYSGEPSAYVTAEVVRGPAGATDYRSGGGRTGGWMLFPSQLPDQTETRVLPGRVKAVAEGVAFRGKHVYTAAEARRTFDLSRPFTVPANTRLQLAWDLGRYLCAYPEVTLSRGRGAKFALSWCEAAVDEGSGQKTSLANARDLIVGRYLSAFGDTFVSDGRRRAVFSSPWFRCGKWIRIDIETKSEPLDVDAVALVESRYPLEMESVFSSPDDRSLDAVRTICARTMQMCCHEMLFDCPFYEQQMYPGDTRVQLNVLSAMSRDERMIRRAIELYDLNTRDDGQCPFNFPTRGLQEGASYTLCYLLMYGDYAMNHADREWLRARLPGLRRTMAGMEYYENADGLLENLPGWNFMDWADGWRNGMAPGCMWGEGVNAELNLYWVLAMRSAAVTERALGNELQAQYWERKASALKETIVRTFWCEERGMLADTPAKKDFSEHAQSLALVGDVLPKEKADLAWRHLIEDGDLKRCTVYFSYYLFEAYFKYGRGDLFLKRLDLWRDYVKKGLTTTQEAPDYGDQESRSDCHAWGAHPIWFMQTGLAGIRSDAPFFAKVRIAPCPGGLNAFKATHPHPQGWISVDLRFDGGKASGSVHVPVPGVFEFGAQKVELKPGDNVL